MKILGISGYYHDSAAALLIDGDLVSAVQEERFTRVKFDQHFPINSIQYCLDHSGLSLSDIDKICFYDDPSLKWRRILDTYSSHTKNGIGPFWNAVKRWCSASNPHKDIKSQFSKFAKDSSSVFNNNIEIIEHHLSHAASAFYPSPYEEAAILTIDGVGEYASTTIAIGEGEQLNMLQQIDFPNSLGLLYSAFTYYLGFKVNSGEYKMMGLAPYGKPVYRDLILQNMVSINKDYSYELNQKYFNHFIEDKMITSEFCNLFGGPPRKEESAITQKECDIAASIQKVIEEIVCNLAETAQEITGKSNLCLAGGVALNCVANGLLKKKKIFENIWIQPAAGDAGGCVGAAYYYYHAKSNAKRIINANRRDAMKGAYLGPEYSNEKISQFLKENGFPYTLLSDQKLFKEVTDLILKGKVVGWFSGRMEFGPRALGGRSILGDPRSSEMQSTLNLKIKYRESFRPFAPSVKREKTSEWFDFSDDSPYMLFVAQVHKSIITSSNNQNEYIGLESLNKSRSTLQAITHVDYSARLQTVHKDTNPRYWKLIDTFEERTGCPVLINTSFNVRGEPIVCSPQDAYACFMNTHMDALVLENHLLMKDTQPVYLSLEKSKIAQPIRSHLSVFNSMLMLAKLYYLFIWFCFFKPVSLFRKNKSPISNKDTSWSKKDNKKNTRFSFAIFCSKMILIPLNFFLFACSLFHRKGKENELIEEISPFTYTLH